MRVALISDVHCAGPSCLRQAEFIRWIDSLDVDALWMLGDVLHYGWDFRGKTQPDFEPVYEAFDRLVGRGVQLRFVPGNHDFAICQLVVRRWGGDAHDPQVCDVDGSRVYLGHGDELDTRLGYRFTKMLLRSVAFKILLACLGLKVGTALLRLLAGSVPEDAGSVWPGIRSRLSAQLSHADIAIVGHVHVEWEQRSEDGVVAVLGPGVAGARLIVDGELVSTPLD